MDKTQIRPIYSELQGYLLQAPEVNKPSDSIDDESVWNQYNNAVDLVTNLTNEDYSRFKLQPSRGAYTHFMRVAAYRQKLGGLISHLHGAYYSDEPHPFGGGPSTVITQSQQQLQSMHIQMILDVQSRIDENISRYEKGTKERKFMEKVKSSLSTVSNVTDLLKLILQTANSFGLDVSTILAMLGLT